MGASLKERVCRASRRDDCPEHGSLLDAVSREGAIIMLAACLGLGCLTSSGGDVLAPEEVSMLAVPRMHVPPAIDGVVGSNEWREAVAISGPCSWDKHVLIPRPTTFFLAWDPEHIYLACRTYLKPGYKPHVPNGRSDGLAYVFDDGLELVLKPMGRNVTFDDAGAAYKFFLNCLGYVGDMTRLELGQQLKNWVPRFKTGARITDPGSAPDGGSWWEVEMSGSLADFNLKGKNSAGDEWRAMLGINHFPIFMQTRIPCIGSYFESECRGYTRLVLVDGKPAVQFIMDSLSNLVTAARASMTISAHNPAKTPADLTIEINVADAIVRQEKLRIPGGGRAEFSLDQNLPGSVTNGKLRVSASLGDMTLLRYVAAFTCGAFPHILAPAQPGNPTEFAFRAVFNPVRNLLEVKGDTYYLPDPAASESMSYTVRDAHGEVITSGTVTNKAEWYYRSLITLPPLKPGTNTVEARITLGDGSVLGPMTANFEKIDEAAAFPEWWGKRFGDVERVLPPFEPIRRATGGGDGIPTFSCWGRTYGVTASGLPHSLVSQGAQVLAAPARIVVKVNGREEKISLGPAVITDEKDWRVQFAGKAEGGGLTFEARGWLEQDGLVYTELTYAPKDGIPLTVDALRMEFPIAEADADCLLCIGPGNNFSSKTTMIIPKGKRGRLWSTLDTGRAGSGMTVGSFYPTVWIGNERRGFLWWADSDRGWFPDDGVPAHEAVREKYSDFASGGPTHGSGTVIVFRNNIIGKPVKVVGPRILAFSYMGTPQKPLQHGWRCWAATEDGTFGVPHRNVRKDSKTGELVNKGGRQKNWIHPASRYPEEWAAMWAEQKTNTLCLGYPGADAYARARLPFNPYAARKGIQWGHMSFTLHGYGEKSLERHLYRYFGAEWYDHQETWNETFTDYVMYLFSRAFKEGGVHSTYWDITFPILHANLIGGLAYELPDGRLQRGYNGWNIRRFFMRLHALAFDNNLLPGCNGAHSTR